MGNLDLRMPTAEDHGPEGRSFLFSGATVDLLSGPAMARCLPQAGSDVTAAERQGPKGLRSFAWTVAGTVCVGLAVIGALLPVMPTVPFLLLAAGCYARGSPKALRWLLGNPVFGRELRNYTEGRGLAARTKSLSISAVIIGTTISMVVSGMEPLIVVVLLIVMAAVVIHLLSLPTSGRPG